MCGQSGHGLAGLWHGIASVPADIDDAMPCLPTACAVIVGTKIPAPSMASMPRIRDQRWTRRSFTFVKLP